MRVRLTGRHDGLLLAGLALALLTIFDQTIGRVLQLASEVEAAYRVRLLPALVVLVAMLIVHLHARRQEMKAEAAAAAAEARVAHERARDLEQLAAFGRALTAALTRDALRAVLWRYMPLLAGRRDVWIGLADGQKFELLLETTGTDQAAVAAEEIGRRLASALAREGGGVSWVCEDGYRCFLISTADRHAGVVALSEDAGDIDERTERTVSAAAALLGIAVRNVQLFAEIRENALTDPLTACFNRGHILQVIEAELRRTRRTQSPLSVVMLDVDQFKAINDRLGHLAGDDVLAAIGLRLRDVLRHSDVRGRFGGDEFLIVLPDTPAAGALHVAEAIRRELEALQIPLASGAERITASVGVATALPGEIEAARLVGRVDRALYLAKAEGRNRVAAAPLTLETSPAPSARRAG